jgi:uncharacterized protein with HEPN domain
VDDGIVWDVIQTKLIALLKDVEALLAKWG